MPRLMNPCCVHTVYFFLWAICLVNNKGRKWFLACHLFSGEHFIFLCQKVYVVKLQRQSVNDMILTILIKVGVMAQSVCFCVLNGFSHILCTFPERNA